MQLSSVQLSGFKSFVDTTKIEFPSQLTGVVGPNGCGKSNIIDAVRWVLGESSAKTLRGAHISDVIFNGSTTRPPSSHASIELSFQNALGKLKGDFARYDQINIRRSVNNEGTSTYHINGIRCRRKDVVDTFLGTGLGPRSYSIIQQGTISRLVESKPEELRLYLEEAASISHYKERRKETYNRIQSTKENLERLLDLSDELEKNLRKLKTQAKNASSYKILHQEKNQLNHELLSLQWHDLEQKSLKIKEKQQSANIRTEALAAKLRKIESRQEHFRQQTTNVREKHQLAQRTFYNAQANIARLQEQITNLNQQRDYMREEQELLSQRKNKLLGQKAIDTAKIEDLQKTLEKYNQQLQTRNLELKEKQNEYLQVEKDYRQLQVEWDRFQAQNYDQRNQSELDQLRIQQLEQKIIDAKKQHEQLSQTLPENIDKLNLKCKEQQKKLQLLEEKHNKQIQRNQLAKATLLETEKKHSKQLQYLHQLQREFQVTEGTIASLETLLANKASGNKKDLAHFVQQYNLTNWIDQVNVKSGWEFAIESAMPELLSMMISTDTNLISDKSKKFLDSSVAIVVNKDNMKVSTLENLFTCHQIIVGTVPAWVHSVFFAETYQQAIKALPKLKSHQRIICKNGVILGSNWIITNCQQQEEDPLLVTRQQLRNQQENRHKLQSKLDTQNKELEKLNDIIHNNKAESEKQQHLSIELERQQIAIQSLVEQLLNKTQALKAEQQENIERKNSLTKTVQETHQELKQVQNTWSKGLENLRYDEEERQKIVDRRSFINKQLNQVRSDFNSIQKEVGEARITQQQAISEHEHLGKSIAQIDQELIELTHKIQNIETQLSAPSSNTEELNKNLQQQLDFQLELEKEMNQQSISVSEHEQALQKEDAGHKKQLEYIQQHQLYTNDFEIKQTEVTTRQQSVIEQLGSSNPQDIFDALPDNAEVKNWQYKIQKIEKQIQVLGEVNHAAIKDFDSEKERKEHIDKQRAEIEDALDTLEKTINTLDKATKNEFQTTFDKVNNNLQLLFPKLLGGGTCKLEMTSNDLLNTGVTIIARPPGKRNTTISMLSGGEKAMTAIALVFAIFQLNPSPFCMLDEVDAPLDDINTLRYVNIVKAMSADVQFIIVSHSKITMANLNHLIGITMSEAGVSRVVSVDIELLASQ